MFFIGRTRFSQCLPETNSWHLSAGEDSVNAYKKKLYDPERLRTREKLFTELTLASLNGARIQAGIDLIHVVSYSESLPERFKKGLHEAAERFPFVYLDEQPDGNWGCSLEEIAQQHVAVGETYGRYRIDDDDVVARDYFNNVAPYIAEPFAGMVVSLPLGIEAIYDSEEISFLRVSHWPMYSLGLLDVCRRSEDGRLIEPRSGAHNMADRRGPVILDSRALSYVRLNHVGQDSGLRTGGEQSMSEIMNSLARLPEVSDLDFVEQQFPHVAAIMQQGERQVIQGESRRVVLPYSLEIPVPLRKVRLVVEHEFSTRSASRAAVVSLDLRDENGNAIPRDLRIKGIGNSRWKIIGHYCYLESVPGLSTTNIDFFLPEGVRLHGLKFLPFGAHSIPFKVHSVALIKER